MRLEQVAAPLTVKRPKFVQSSPQHFLSLAVNVVPKSFDCENKFIRQLNRKEHSDPLLFDHRKLVFFSSDFNEISSAGSSCIYLQLYFWVRVDGTLKSAANLR